MYSNVSNLSTYINISSCQFFCCQLKNHDLPKCNHHVKPFLKSLNFMLSSCLRHVHPTNKTKSFNSTSWCYPNQIFDCITTLIIWVHFCLSQLCGHSINIFEQSIIHTQILKLPKLDDKFFLTASLSGHMIRFLNKIDRGFIHFQKMFHFHWGSIK